VEKTTGRLKYSRTRPKGGKNKHYSPRLEEQTEKYGHISQDE